MNYRSMLLAGAPLIFVGSPALAQEAPTTPPQQPATAPTAQQDSAGGASRRRGLWRRGSDRRHRGPAPRGSVVGDIPPQNILDSRDVRATGATSINDLLDALAPQIGSAQGRSGERPVLLLNGQRIASFREIRDIPPEAIERLEILPEEVALKYGYRADQKVVNIVLRQRFRSTTAQVGAGRRDRGRLRQRQCRPHAILGPAQRPDDAQRARRGQQHAHRGGARHPAIAPPTDGTIDEQLAARSLVGTKRDVRGVRRRSTGRCSAMSRPRSIREVEHTDGRSLIGLGDTLLHPLARNTSTDTAHAGADAQRHQVALALDADQQRRSRARPSPAPIATTRRPRDRSRETTASADIKATANGNLFALPAGNASTTITLAGSTVHLDSTRTGSESPSRIRSSRTTGEAAINLDLPISRRNRDFSALGNLTLNGNAEVDQLSDFGTLTTIGAGVNWSPVDRLNLLASWTREEGPPTINQLGDPVLETPGHAHLRLHDGPDGARRPPSPAGTRTCRPTAATVTKLSAQLAAVREDRPAPARRICSPDDRPSDLEPQRYRRRSRRPSPDRFVRDASGQLISADLRPVNFESSQRDTLRIGFDFSKPLEVAPAVASGDRPDARAVPARRSAAPIRGPRHSAACCAGAKAPRRRPPAARALRPAPRRQRRRRGGGGFGGRGGGGGAASAAATAAGSPSR